MKYRWEHTYKHRAAKRGWTPLLLFVIGLIFVVVIDWEIGIRMSALVILGFIFWGIFAEPRTLLVKKRYFDLGCSSKIALISDLHLGIYKKQKFLEKIIKKINLLHVDYLFIAGDLTYYPKTKDLNELFAPLAKCHVPVYVVLGNHDVEKPGHPVRDQLVAALRKAGVHFLNNTIVHLNGFTLVGLGEYRSHEDDIRVLDYVSHILPVIVLTHNPATIKKYNRHHVDLTLCGHTHGWQITLPFLEHLLGFFSRKLKHFSSGYLNHGNYQFFVTCGVGEVGLPMRLFSPPTIDVLYLGQKRITVPKKIKNQIKEYTSRLGDILLTKNQ